VQIVNTILIRVALAMAVVAVLPASAGAVDNCSSSPCLNGGNCVDEVIGFTCECLPGWTGVVCENVDDCGSAPCQNGGSCVDGDNTFTCNCLPGFTGTVCENVDDCASAPCQNGAGCVDGDNTFTCNCLPGFTGTVCENVDDCGSAPCQNGGSCVDGDNTFTCSCLPGWTGFACETDIDECAANPCQNGGLCNNLVGGYTCDCPGGFTGTNCEVDVDECASNPCQNGGTCTDGVGTFTCDCLCGYAGALCELAAPAVDIGVIPTKLIAVDKLAAAGKAKIVFVSKDQEAGITKGCGTDVDQIGAEFDMVYANGSAAGAFTLPMGASDGTAGWLTNKEAVAKYVNKDAPVGPTQAKVAVVKPGKLLKLVGQGLGDTPLDIFTAGDPGAGGVETAYCVTNGAEEFCHCSAFDPCVFKVIAGGTGAKLVCKTGTADPGCSAIAP